MELFDSMLASSGASRLQRARITVVPAEYSWVALPGPLVTSLMDRQLQTPLVLRLSVIQHAACAPAAAAPRSAGSSFSSGRVVGPPRFVAWAGAASSSPGTIELAAGLAAALHLPSGTEVSVELLPALAAASAVEVEPVGPADWEVVELNAGLLEQVLLSQAGVVAVGQPFPLWARQARVMLRVASITHAAEDAAAAAAARGGGPLLLRDVARLTAGTELHIAPKPRVSAAGSGPLRPGQLPLAGKPPLAAAADAAPGSPAPQEQAWQQQQQQPKPAWLRVQDAPAAHLLDIKQHQHSNTNKSNSNSSNGHSGAPVVRSWLTTAVTVSSRTASDLGLTPGGLVRLSSNSSSSSGSGSSGGSALPLQSVVVLLLVDPGVAWGHVALAPPLQECLAVAAHQYVKLQPLQQQVQQLQQLPGFVLHPLLPLQAAAPAAGAAPGPAAAAAAGGASAAGSRVGVGVAAVHGLGAAVAAAAAGGPQHSQPRCSISEIEELPDTPAAAAATTQQQQQQVHEAGDSFTGIGLVQGLISDAVKRPLQLLSRSNSREGPLLSRSSSREVAPVQQHHHQQQQSTLEQQDSALQQERQRMLSQQELLPPALQQPAVKSAAMTSWLQLQLLGVAACMAGAADHSSSSSSSSGGGSALPCCGPLVVHFRLCGAAADQQQQQQQQQLDHLMLLLPHSLPAGALAPGKSSSSSSAFLLQGELLQQCAAATNKPGSMPQQQLDILVGGVLTFDAAATAAPPSHAAVQHKQHITFINGSCCCSSQHTRSQQLQQAQQQQAEPASEPPVSSPALIPDDFPWLNPALQSALGRLNPRLSLLSWQAWQGAGLPLPGGVLLVGGSDSGRGWLLQLLGQQAADKHRAHVLKVSCKGLAGQSYDAAAAVLAAAVAEASAACPGLLLLDDLDLLAPAATGEGTSEQDQTTATRLAEWLASLMRWAGQQPHPVSFAAACSNAAALPAVLRAAGCLDTDVKVPPFGVRGRAALLLAGFRAKGLKFIGGVAGLEGLAGQGLDGFDARDLQLVVDRAVHAALRRQLSAGPAAEPAADSHNSPQQQQLCVSAADVAEALAGFVPAAFWRAGQHQGQQQQEGGVQGWQDVGGLSEAVAALHEALVMPAKYGHLLATAPLRLRTGLLLFGPPGCGKTHVVAAAVAATRARLISVKGPELLNKYIGQSEAAVRELFGRAAAAAPCVLFFDEFDAIAPPRGHDSTGVTDRVVNQLLTELDGVEGLTGVAVLAATSRPDLIDAALLRPGRLDRMVFCGFPTQPERLAILAAAARQLPLAPDVNLPAVAAATANFTGADLAAVLSEAQLLAVHEQLGSRGGESAGQASSGSGGSGGRTLQPEEPAVLPSVPVLQMRHVQRALTRARPSLPAAEQRRLAAVYARFQQSRDPGLSNRPVLDEEQQGKKHATLA